MVSVNLEAGANRSFLRRKWDSIKNAVHNCNATDFITKVAPRVALNATGLGLGIASLSSVKADSPWTPLANVTMVGGILYAAGGFVEGMIGLDDSAHRVQTKEDGLTLTKSLGDILTGGGLIAASGGAGPISLIPMLAGMALNSAASIVSMKKQ